MKTIPTARRFNQYGDTPLEALKGMTRYELALAWENRHEVPLTREQKDLLMTEMTSSGYGKPMMQLLGWQFYLEEMPSFYVEQYGNVYIKYAPDKTAIRKGTHSRIDRINPRTV